MLINHPSVCELEARSCTTTHTGTYTPLNLGSCGSIRRGGGVGGGDSSAPSREAGSAQCSRTQTTSNVTTDIYKTTQTHNDVWVNRRVAWPCVQPRWWDAECSTAEERTVVPRLKPPQVWQMTEQGVKRGQGHHTGTRPRSRSGPTHLF